MAAVGSVLISSPANADAEAQGAPAIADQVAPQLLANAAELSGVHDGFSADAAGTEVTYPTSTSDAIAVRTQVGDAQRDYSIGIPSSGARAEQHSSLNAVSYDNADGSSTVSSTREDGSVVIGTTIESASAPSEYSYPINVDGAAADLTVEDDGSVTVSDDAGDVITHFLAPWALDAAGADVSTRYEVDGNVLTQVVDHKGASYPVVADPTSSKYFSKVVVDKTSSKEGTIVRVYPGPGMPPAGRGSGDSIYNDYKTLVSSSYEGRKWRDQLVCHWANAGRFKVPWNLDSWRPDVGYTKTVAALCNPK
ncbi:DUF2599 domain-containing protein [Curtobacterium sp. BH-2-1-1]|uniref:DUF2599 domain-containing protein n=1 Tax=Curtobacterium sp. BH-2-1-1 TaxID=1905847 RepID=UPI00164309A4|nr:DUF2599 domain-containing protein [Curtobacterium sp. BH-2-1-1]